MIKIQKGDLVKSASTMSGMEQASTLFNAFH